MAPSLIASYEVDSAAANNVSLVSPSFTPSNGEVLVVKVVTADDGQTIGTPSGGSQVFTSRAASATSSTCWAAIFTAVVSGSPGSMTVTVGLSGSTQWHSMVVERWGNAQLAATPATNDTKTGSGIGPSATLTTVAANSIVTNLDGDWNAVAPGSPAYRSSGTQDGLHDKSAIVQYVAYYWYQSAASAGSQTIGLTTPASAQKWTMLGIEVQDADGAPAAATPQPFNFTSAAVQRAASW